MANIKDQYEAALRTYPGEPPKPIDQNKLHESTTQGALRARLRGALNATVDPLALAEITRRLVDEAKLGSFTAMKLLFELLNGRPETETAESAKPIMSPAEIEKTLRDLGYERKR